MIESELLRLNMDPAVGGSREKITCGLYRLAYDIKKNWTFNAQYDHKRLDLGSVPQFSDKTI